mmetsp:Transcript_5672/g.13722  ORF Transcript_5672/g.13722 Transcript_5672/m.13722 type:complete len:260 (+) Transcript_5672:2-781(+)
MDRRPWSSTAKLVHQKMVLREFCRKEVWGIPMATFILQSIIGITGAVQIAFGVLIARNVPPNLTVFFEVTNPDTIAALNIVDGALFLINTIIGLWGAAKQRRWLLATYGLLFIVSFAISITVLGITIHSYVTVSNDVNVQRWQSSVFFLPEEACSTEQALGCAGFFDGDCIDFNSINALARCPGIINVVDLEDNSTSFAQCAIEELANQAFGCQDVMEYELNKLYAIALTLVSLSAGLSIFFTCGLCFNAGVIGASVQD